MSEENIPVYTPVGERGPAGDRGRSGDPGVRGERGGTGEQGIAGPAGTSGRNGARGSIGPVAEAVRGQKLFHVLVVLLGILVVLIVAVALYVAIRAQDGEAAVREKLAEIEQKAEETTERAERERQLLLSEIEQLRSADAADQQADECLELYQSDLDDAEAVSQKALATLFESVVSLDPALLPEDRAARVAALVAENTKANVPLGDAIEAQRFYRAIDPPPNECPHPDAKP